MTDDIAGLSLTQVTEAIRRRRLSSAEVTGACLARIERLAPKLNCVRDIDADTAMAAACRADDALAAGNSIGPLHGVPLAHKDMYYRTGRISGCGSVIRADFVPERTAMTLQKLDTAGALDVARLNMVEFALGLTGHSEVTPTPKNPWNTDYITGGSSSGCGAAVAGRLVFGSLGSDTGGSIRFPASCCGVVGIKPTLGRVSRIAVMPLSHSLDTLGPLTRTVADNALMLRTIAGHDPADPASSPLPVPDYMDVLELGVKGLRLGVPETYFYEPVDSEVTALLDASIELYRRLGAQIVPVTIPESVATTNDLTSLITSTEAAALHQKWIQERPEDYGKQTLGRLIVGLTTPATRYLQALNLRRQFLDQFVEAVFQNADVLHSPVMIMPVPTLAESDMAANPGFSAFIATMGHCTRPINYLGLPALSVPCGFTESGLPTSFQLVGRPFDESTLYRLGRAYERETDWTEYAPEL